MSTTDIVDCPACDGDLDLETDQCRDCGRSAQTAARIATTSKQEQHESRASQYGVSGRR